MFGPCSLISLCSEIFLVSLFKAALDTCPVIPLATGTFDPCLRILTSPEGARGGKTSYYFFLILSNRSSNVSSFCNSNLAGCPFVELLVLRKDPT